MNRPFRLYLLSFVTLLTLFSFFSTGCKSPHNNGKDNRNKSEANSEASNGSRNGGASDGGKTFKNGGLNDSTAIHNHSNKNPNKVNDLLGSPNAEKEDSNTAYLYLSFDDGPNPGTSIVLNILQQEEIPATFFIIGLHAYASPAQKQLWRRLQSTPNIMLANHSYTHGFRNRYEHYYNHPDSVVKDFQRCADSLRFNNKLARTPSSNIWRLPSVHRDYYARRKAAADSLYNKGFQLVGWDVEWSYNGKMELRQTAEEMLAEIHQSVVQKNLTRIPKHVVMLAHDHTFTDAQDSTRLHDFIRLVKKNPHYRWRLLSDYPGLKEP
jgi:peptidoglycan/xylan/chitin deacetylase (PgdA/CDA1 family)